MVKQVEWTPGDYSPTYIFTVDDNGDFVELKKILNLPSCYDEAKEIEIKQHHIEYISGNGFQKYIKHRSWLGDEVYKNKLNNT